MTLSDAGTARRPSAPAGAGAPKETQADAEPWLLAGQVGAEVATALSSALQRVRLLVATGRIGQRSLHALQDELEQARRVAMLGQQVSRLAAGRVRQLPESLELPQLLRDALGQRSNEMAARGLEVRQRLEPAAAMVDPSLLFALLVSLLDWAFEHCRSHTLSLSTGLHPWPEHALLHCEFAWRAPDRLAADADADADPARDTPRTESAPDTTALDTVPWRLVEQACRAMGVRIERRDTAWQIKLTLAFPETPRRWPKLVDELTAQENPYAMRTQPLAGSQLLVLATRADVRRLVHEATAQMGLRMVYADTLAEARDSARQQPPDVLVIDDRNTEIDRLLADLKAGGAGPALVQVNAQFKGLEVSTTSGFEIMRVSTEGVMRELPAALRYALTVG